MIAFLTLVFSSCFTLGNSNITAGEVMGAVFQSVTEPPSYYSPKSAYGDYRGKMQKDVNPQSVKNDSIKNKWKRQ